MILLPCLLASWSSGVADPFPARDEVAGEERAREIDRRIEALVEEGLNASVLVAVEGEVLLRKGYGWTDDSRRHAISAETVFNLASVSKPFAACAILRLQEDGLLAMNEPIDAFLSGEGVTHRPAFEQR